MPEYKSLLAVTLVFLTGCDAANNPSSTLNRLEPIVRRLHSGDVEERKSATDALHELADHGLSESEGAYALRAAGERFPALEYDWQDASEELVIAASQNLHPQYAEIIDSHFTSYSPAAQAQALWILGTLKDRQAAQTLVRLLGVVSKNAPFVSFGKLAEIPRYPDVIFPAIIPYVHRPNLRWAVSEVFLAYLSAGLVSDERSRQQISQAMIAIHNELQTTLVPLQQEKGEAWIWEDSYQDARSMAALALDVLGRVGTKEAETELSESVAYHDARLKMFAILGLVRFGREPSPIEFELVARSAESRIWLYRQLDEMKRLDLYPPQYGTQKAFAEGVMVDWLVYPTELARTPDEIELTAVVPRTYVDGDADFYVFRFRTLEPHWAAEDGWIAGIAGPFLKSEVPTPESHGGTFSDFAPWDQCSPEEHVERIEALLEKSRLQAGA